MHAYLDPLWAQLDMLREARLAVRTYIAAEDEEQSPEERWPDLFIGGEFSAKLMRTYNVVIFGIAIAVGIAHWYGQLKSRKRRRSARHSRETGNQEENISKQKDHYETTRESLRGEAGSSSSGNSSGSSTLDFGYSSETTKLLGGSNAAPISGLNSNRTRPQYALDSIRGWLAYQPEPIPFFNKTLPSNGATLAGTLFVLFNILYLVLGMKWRILYVVVFGDRCALVFIYNLPLLYLLASKTQPLSFITGYSYEALNIIHRRLGEVMCFCGLLHSIFMFLSYYTFLSTVGFTLYTFVFSPTVLTGIALLISYEALYFTSLASFRARWYEIFLATHVILQAGALALLYFHHRNNKLLVLVALSIFLTDRLVYRIGMKSTTVMAEVTVAEDEQTVILKASVPFSRPGFLASMFGHQITHSWEPTDHVFLTAPSLGQTHMLQAHPFTILSPSPWSLSPALVDGEVMQLDLLIRAYDGFTSDLLKHAFMDRTLRVRIDGPYGGCHARDAVEDAEQAILVAGGSGIAVIWPIVHFLIASSRGGGGVDSESTSGAGVTRKILLIWVVQQRSQLSWLSARALEEVRLLGVEVIIPQPTSEAGRPDLTRLINERVVECRARTGVVASGPDSMGRAVRNACAELIGEGKDVKVNIEKFGW